MGLFSKKKVDKNKVAVMALPSEVTTTPITADGQVQGDDQIGVQTSRAKATIALQNQSRNTTAKA